MTKKLSLFMLLAGVLVACNSYTVAEPTITSVPSPTFTPLPTITPTLEINGIEVLKAQFAEETKGYLIIKSDGAIYEINNGLEVLIPGVIANNDGNLWVVVNSVTGETMRLSPEDWSVDQFGLLIENLNFNYATDQWEIIPDKEFSTKPLREYRQNIITIQDLMDGSYCKYVLRNFPHQFVVGEYKNIQMKNYGTRIAYNVETSPNFPQGTVAPFAWKFTASFLKIDVWEYMILPILFPDPNPDLTNDPSYNICIPAIAPLNNIKNIQMSTLGVDPRMFEMFETLIHAPDFQTITYHYSAGVEIPLVRDIYTDIIGNDLMAIKFQKFLTGNNRALSNTPVYFIIKDSDYNK